MFILRPPLFIIVYVQLFWSGVLGEECLLYFYFEMEGSYPSEGAGKTHTRTHIHTQVEAGGSLT